jgi:iron(III) transport system substrate-binding protein
MVYNAQAVEEAELPDSVLDLTDESWSGRVGWAPTNGSFQAFVTALRLVEGEDEARTWLEGMEAGGVQDYEGNSQIVQAVAAREIDAGLVNHYYLLELGSEDASIKENAANHFFDGGDVGSIVNAAGVGIIEGTDAPQGAQAFVDFMLSRTGEQYFDEEVYEYPLSGEATRDPSLPDLDSVEQPDIDLSDLSDLEGTLDLLRETGVL